MVASLSSLLGDDDLGQLALNLLGRSPAPSTYASYDIGLKESFKSCVEDGINPLNATPVNIVRYTAWLGRLGTISAALLQPYYSAINKLLSNHQRQPVPVGDLHADTRRGLVLRQQRLVTAATRVPLSVPVADDIMQWAAGERDALD
jgi:hypothetical protein